MKLHDFLIDQAKAFHRRRMDAHEAFCRHDNAELRPVVDSKKPICKECGEPFEPKRSDQTCCGKRCKVRFHSRESHRVPGKTYRSPAERAANPSRTTLWRKNKQAELEKAA